MSLGYVIFFKSCALPLSLLLHCDQHRQHIKKQKHYFANKGLPSQSYAFSSSHVWMRMLDNKESWVLKNWSFWTVVLGKIFESPLDCKEIKPVSPKGNQSWIFIERTIAKAEALILWPPDAKSWLIGKDPDIEKDWKEKKRVIEDEIVRSYYWLIGHDLEQILGDNGGQRSLECCSPWNHKEADMT